MHAALSGYLDSMQADGKAILTVQNHLKYCKSYLLYCGMTEYIIDTVKITPDSVGEYTSSLWVLRRADSTIISMVSGVLAWCEWLEMNGKVSPESPFRNLKAKGLLASLKKSNPMRANHRDDDD